MNNLLFKIQFIDLIKHMGGKFSEPSRNTDVSVKYENYVMNNAVVNNRAYPLKSTEDADYLYNFNQYSKGVKSIESMKKLETEKESKIKNKQEINQEKFKGFAYKNRNIEPFEKTYISY